MLFLITISDMDKFIYLLLLCLKSIISISCAKGKGLGLLSVHASLQYVIILLLTVNRHAGLLSGGVGWGVV